MNCLLTQNVLVSLIFEVLTVVTVKNTVMWVIMPYILIDIYQHLGGTCLHLQVQRLGQARKFQKTLLLIISNSSQEMKYKMKKKINHHTLLLLLWHFIHCLIPNIESEKTTFWKLYFYLWVEQKEEVYSVGPLGKAKHH